jgi:hypothetical protein
MLLGAGHRVAGSRAVLAARSFRGPHVGYARRIARSALATSAPMRCGTACGAWERSASPASPSVEKRRTHCSRSSR